jgi:dGTPase
MGEKTPSNPSAQPPKPNAQALQSALNAARAPYATNPAQSRGRLVEEPACPMRTPFQRDRDRIIHATAFRRLTHKTQVFLYHEGDHYRTRLTHTIEVAQIARAIARQLRLDEDLTEALALAHDLGHPPFGHAGERALDHAMTNWGGFDHNAQSLKVVTRLERKYARFDGLNLTYESLEGLVKHNGPLTGPLAHEARPGEHRLILQAIERAGLREVLRLDRYASLEAQAAAIADDIAYVNHDIDDALRAKLLVLDDLADVPLAGPFVKAAIASSADPARVIYEVNRRMITAMIEDCVGAARARLEILKPHSAESAVSGGQAMIKFSDAFGQELRSLKAYLFRAVYRHERVMRVMRNAESIVTDLFARYSADATALPENWQQTIQNADDQTRAALIGDFVAGMTDRYAIEAHKALFPTTPELR